MATRWNGCAIARHRTALGRSKSLVCGASRRQLLSASAAGLAGLVTHEATAAASNDASAAASVYDFTVKQFDADVPLSKYRGEVLVIVNVASE